MKDEIWRFRETADPAPDVADEASPPLASPIEREAEPAPDPAPSDQVEPELTPPRSRGVLRRLGVATLKAAATLAICALAALGALLIWDYYVIAPWTRDGRIRAQVASVAPQVSGQIVEMRAADDQFVHKGDVLYVIDPFDFKVALAQARAQLRLRAADLEVKRVESERRKNLTELATTAEEQQLYAGNAEQAHAGYDSAQSQLSQATINLQRTEVRSPVNGYITNLLMRVGDFAHAGASNISIIDADSFWIDGYFEETKMARVCVGDRAEAQLMGYARPLVGRVQTVTRGISVLDAAPSTQGLPNVDPVFTWVRLAQRVPVRIAIADVPPGVPLISGMTATVTIRDGENHTGGNGLSRLLGELRERIGDVLDGPASKANCAPPLEPRKSDTIVLETPQPPQALSPKQLVPDLETNIDRLQPHAPTTESPRSRTR